MKSWFQSRSTPEEKAQEAARKKQQQDEAAAKKQQRQEARTKKKTEAKAAAQRKKAHKKGETAQRKQQAAERKKGVATRKQVTAEFATAAGQQKASAEMRIRQREAKRKDGGLPAIPNLGPGVVSGPLEVKEQQGGGEVMRRFREVDAEYHRLKREHYDRLAQPLIGEALAQLQAEQAATGGTLTAEELRQKAMDELPLEQRRQLTEISTHHAYQATWLKLDEANATDAKVRAFRPNEETVAERMQNELGSFRADYLDAAQRQKDVRKTLKMGRTASPVIEALYEEQEKLVLDWSRSADGTPPQKTETQALDDARDRVWGRYAKPFEADLSAIESSDLGSKEAQKQITDQRERYEAIVRKREGIDFGGAIDFRLRMDARRRLAAREAKVGKSQRKKDQHAVNLTQQVVDPIAGAAGGGVKAGTMGTGMAGMVVEKTSSLTGGEDEVGWLTKTGQVDTTAASKFLGDFDALFSSITTVLGNMGELSRLFTDEDTESGVSKNPERWATAVDTGAEVLKGSIATLKGAAEVVVVSFNAAEGVVGYVVPGLDIATRVINLTTSAVHLGVTGARLAEVNKSLAKARSRPQAIEQLDVLVNPFLKMQSKYGKQVEYHSFAVAKSLVDIAASIANLASAGGYGVPKAVQGAASLVSMLHSLSHTIADNILAAQAQTARKNAKVLHLEGAAEELQRKDVSTAVDVILIRAQRDKDPVAISYLKSFGISTERIAKNDPLENYRIHRKLMREMKEDEDPKWLWPKLVDTAGKVGKVGGELGHIGKQVDAMYEARGHDKNVAGKSWWYTKMYLEALVSHDKFVRSKRKTETAQGHKLLEAKLAIPGVDASSGRVPIAKVGDAVLYANAAETTGADGSAVRDTAGLKAEEEAFLAAVEQASIEQLRAAAAAEYHPPDWRDFFHQVLIRKMREQSTAA